MLNCETVKELQNLSVINSIDFRKQNGCHRISDKIDVTSLAVELANDSLVDIELVEKSIQPTIEAAWAHGLAECQVKHFFHGMTRPFVNTALMELRCQCLT